MITLYWLDASFSENFYGLKRRRRPWVETVRTRAAVGGIPTEETLRRGDIRRSLLLLVRSPAYLIYKVSSSLKVGLPYLRAKAQDYYEELGGGVTLEDASERTRASPDQVR